MKIQNLVNSMSQLAIRPSFVRTKLGCPLSLLAAIGLLNGSAPGAVPRDFVPDVAFAGSALNGWHVLGNAVWRAEDGEIIGAPARTNGGWLVLDKGYQDIEIH